MPKKDNTHSSLARFTSLSPHILFFCVLFFICLSYSNTLYSPIVLDDQKTFIDEPKVYIDNISFESLRQLSSTRFGLFRLIPLLTFAIDHLVGKGSIVQFHLTNILIHILSTTTVYLLMRAICFTSTALKSLTFISPATFSLFVTALWALHPVQTNAVTYLVQRMASLVALFYFAALTCYIWARNNTSIPQRNLAWCGFIVFSLCAFLSKENSFTLPVALLLIEMLFISPELGKNILTKIRWPQLVGLAIVFLLFLPLIYAYLSTIDEAYLNRHFTIVERLLTELRVIVFYLSLLAFPLPSRFNLEHDFTLSHSFWAPPTTLMSLLFLVFLLWIAFKARRQNQLISFGILFFFLNLVMESSIVGLELVFEHRLYLPALGFFCVIFALVDKGIQFVPAKNDIELKQIVFLGAVIIACVFTTFTSLRNAVWQDEYTLLKDCAQKSPNKPRVLNNLGVMLAKSDRTEEALATLEHTISLGKENYEEYLKAANNIVNILREQGKFQEAVDRTEKYLKERPKKIRWDGFQTLMTNLGICYWKLGDLQNSFEAFSLAASIQGLNETKLALGAMEALLLEAMANEKGRLQLELENKPVAVYRKIAATLFAKRDYSNTEKYLKIALEKDPNDSSTLIIKQKYENELKTNKRARAEATFNNNPVTINNSQFRLYLLLASFIEKSYQPLECSIEYLLEKAVQLEPKDSIAAYYLARWRFNNGQTYSALKLAEQYLISSPNFFPLLELAGLCHLKQKNSKQAAIMFSRLLAIYPGHPDWAEYESFIRIANKTR